MNVLGQVMTEASATVTRAPQNLWMDEAQQAEADTEVTISSNEGKASK